MEKAINLKLFDMTVGGVVMGPRGSFMHPESFRDMFGEEAYQELLKKPRVVTSYDIEDSE